MINKLRDAANENLEMSRKQMRELRHRLRTPEARAKYEAEEAARKEKEAAAKAEAKAKEEEEAAKVKALEEMIVEAHRTQMEQTELLRDLVTLLKKEA